MSQSSKNRSSVSHPDIKETRNRLARLLTEHARLAACAIAVRSGLEAPIPALLAEFGQLRKRADDSAQIEAHAERNRIDLLLMEYNQAEERDRRQQEETADDFNLLDVFRMTGKEIRHSMVLAWLLDHDMRRLGTHAQGNLGFRLFLSELGLPSSYANSGYWVRREVAGDESIVDVEVACRGAFLIHIENKIWSGEGSDQTQREWLDLHRRARALQVNAAGVHAVFLTPTGTTPSNPKFRPVSWRHIARVLDRFAAQAKPQDVKLFASHYAHILRRFILIENMSENDHAERPDE